ncbi:unnamed protein product [marine sediment metagenome]|uniref:Uncharacterized protein n=1 Tax=marine sediment metagenome TaxID=412755 RepID=X1AKR6_9ZZZZ
MNPTIAISNNTATYIGSSPDAKGFFFNFSICFLSFSTSIMSFMI